MGKIMKQKIVSGLIIALIGFIVLISGCIEESTSEPLETLKPLETLNPDNVTTTWDLSFIYEDKGEALVELEALKQDSTSLNETFRPRFETLNGTVLLDYLEAEKEYLISLDKLWTYTYAQNSLNVTDVFYETLLADIQDHATDYDKTTSFATVKLSSFSKAEWDTIFNEEPGLEGYKAYLESNYIRFADHRPQNESHAVYLADLSNQRMKLQTEAFKTITTNVTMAGNITLDNGDEYNINAQSYYALLSTDTNRNNRKKGYDKRMYHLINESNEMAQLYGEKARLDDQYARELDYSDAYEAKLFGSYLTKDQVDDMNTVFKARKDSFEPYNEFRKEKLDLTDQLMPYDLFMQLMEEPDRKYNYTDSLMEIQASYAQMGPEFNDIFLETVTGNYIDVYPNPENGKQPGGYAASLCAMQAPSIIFINYNGLINDKKTITHEMGHGINFYLMGNSVDFLYCRGPEYEMEIPSTFNEELFVDQVIANEDKDTSVAVLSQHIGEYQNYFSFQPLITEFEYKAHAMYDEQDNVSGADMNALWTDLYRDYRSDSIGYYDEDSAEWTYISHIYLTNNYYTFNYAVSKAITLSLFKQYREDPEEFSKNYIAYLSTGTTITPPEKLKQYFGIEVNRQLFEDAMDVVELRIDELNELEQAQD